MSHHHDESEWPIIWEVLDDQGKRLTILINKTREEAEALAVSAFPTKSFTVVDTGKRKPPNKCCNTCGNKPCGS